MDKRVDSKGRVRPKKYIKHYQRLREGPGKSKENTEGSVTPEAAVNQGLASGSHDDSQRPTNVDVEVFEDVSTSTEALDEHHTKEKNFEDMDIEFVRSEVSTETMSESFCDLTNLVSGAAAMDDHSINSNTELSNLLNSNTHNEALDGELPVLPDFISEDDYLQEAGAQYGYKDEQDDVEFQDENDECMEDNGDFETRCNSEKPIYPGHFLSVKVSVLTIWMYVMAHSTSGAQLSDLLTLIGLHCVQVHPAMKSVYNLKKYFAHLESSLIRHYYCSNCLVSVKEDAEVCPNSLCLKDLTLKRAKLSFLEYPVSVQIQKLFQRKNFLQHIGYRFNRTKSNPHNVEDIYDGLVYRNLSSGDGPLSDKHPYNLSFTVNTDGVPLFKSSKMSIWPIYLTINELPPNLRFKKDYMIFCGMWYGDSKPNMFTFGAPLHKAINKLEEEGTEVLVGDRKIRIQCFLLCMTADLPARSLYLNMTQFNGDYSCIKCLQRGENYRTDKGGNIHVFPFQTDDPTGPQRNSIDSKAHAHAAVESKQTVFGIKGPSVLMSHKYFDLVRSSVIDYMHCVLLGTQKLLMNLWFTATSSSELFSLYKYLDTVDERLVRVKPPNSISRLPRTIRDHLKFWKASEFRSWLFYYSLPILSDLMLCSYFYHYSAFVSAIYILSQDSISLQHIDLAEEYLKYFVCMFSALYSPRYSTLNLHSLLHLPQCVRDNGPLWVYSCFAYEDANGDLVSMFHGTQYVDVQIVNAISLAHVMPLLIEDIPQQSQVYPFLQRMAKRGRQRKGYERDNITFSFRGKAKEKVLNGEIYLLVTQFLNLIPDTCNLIFYDRVYMRGHIYHSTEYKPTSSRNSSVVRYIPVSGECIRFGIIEWFAKYSPDCEHTDTGTSCTCKQVAFACVCRLKKSVSILQKNLNDCEKNVEGDDIRKQMCLRSDKLQLQLRNILFFDRNTNDFEIIPVRNILALCVLIHTDQGQFISLQPNMHEGD